MTLIEFIIVYLACGAPFAVFRATSERRQSSLTLWIRFSTAMFTWPFVAMLLLKRHFHISTTSQQTAIEGIRVKMETAAFPDNQIQGVFDFRDTFYRFVGLSNAVNEPETETPTNQLFEIGGGGDARISARCLSRRNRIRLHRHYLQARREFMSSIANRNDEELGGLASELAVHLGDPLVRGELLPHSSRQEKIMTASKALKFKTAKASVN